MKEVTTITPHSLFIRGFSLILAELFLASSLFPAWANPLPSNPSLLRTRSTRDGGSLKDLRKEFVKDGAARDGGRVTAATEKGARTAQQDRYVNTPIETQDVSHGQGQLMAVMDGHGGDQAAEKVAEFLSDIFKDALMHNEGRVEEALRETTEVLHRILKEEASGTTLSVVYVPKDEARAYVAILGDSPVVILDKDNRMNISPVHNIRSNLTEREAAVKRGAFYDPTDGFIKILVDGKQKGLQISRALGSRVRRPMLGHEPDIYSVPLGAKSFILVGTDGLFDPFNIDTPEEIGKVISLLHEGKDAQALVKDALRRDTGDNATAIVWRPVQSDELFSTPESRGKYADGLPDSLKGWDIEILGKKEKERTWRVSFGGEARIFAGSFEYQLSVKGNTVQIRPYDESKGDFVGPLEAFSIGEEFSVSRYSGDYAIPSDDQLLEPHFKLTVLPPEKDNALTLIVEHQNPEGNTTVAWNLPRASAQDGGMRFGTPLSRAALLAVTLVTTPPLAPALPMVLTLPLSQQTPQEAAQLQKTKNDIVSYLKSLAKELEKEEPTRREVLKFLIDVFELTALEESMSLRGPLFMMIQTTKGPQGHPTVAILINPRLVTAFMEASRKEPRLKTVVKSLLLKETGSADASAASIQNEEKRKIELGEYRTKIQAGLDIQDASFRQLVRKMFSDWINNEYTGDVRMYTYLQQKGMGPKALDQLASRVDSSLRAGVRHVGKTYRNIMKNGRIDERRMKIAFALLLYRAVISGAITGERATLIRQVFAAEMHEGNVTPEQLKQLLKDQTDIDQVAKPSHFLRFLTATTQHSKDGGRKVVAVEAAQEIRKSLVQRLGSEEKYLELLDLVDLEEVLHQLRNEFKESPDIFLHATILLREVFKPDRSTRLLRKREPVIPYRKDPLIPLVSPLPSNREKVIVMTTALLDSMNDTEVHAFLTDPKWDDVLLYPTRPNWHWNRLVKEREFNPMAVDSEEIVFFADSSTFTRFSEKSSGPLYGPIQKWKNSYSLLVKVTDPDIHAMLKVGRDLLNHGLRPETLDLSDRLLLQILTELPKDLSLPPKLSEEVTYLKKVLVDVLWNQL